MSELRKGYKGYTVNGSGHKPLQLQKPTQPPPYHYKHLFVPPKPPSYGETFMHFSQAKW